MTIILFLTFAALLFLFLIAPRTRNKPDHSRLLGRYYAHRGLHDHRTGTPENSMAAFRKAVEAGFGIELDVQLTKDRLPVVFHDEHLQRMCGVNGTVREYTYEELQTFPLLGTAERIPLFQEVLDLVDGKVPLIIELKIHEDPDAVCSLADTLLRHYRGPCCVESFHPLALLWYRRHRPQVLRGQLSTAFSGVLRPLGLLLTNVLSRPDFIAYDHLHKRNLSRILCRRLFGALSVAWTVKSQEELDRCRADYDLFIFEGFLPESSPGSR